MKTVGTIRVENLLQLIKEFGTMEAVAERVGSTAVYLSQVKNATRDVSTGRPRQMGSAMARRIEKACGKPEGWMDAAHDAIEIAGGAETKTSASATLGPPEIRFVDAMNVVFSALGSLRGLPLSQAQNAIRYALDHPADWEAATTTIEQLLGKR